MGGLPFMGDDYVWFGRDLELGSVPIKNDLIAAGQVITLSQIQAAGSIRVAGQTITISDSTAKQNVTVAGQTIVLGNTKANAVAIAGESVRVSGTCEELTVFAKTVYLDGTVNGNVNVGAQTVEVGTNARIKGTLHVSAEQEPTMQRGAEVGSVDFTKQDTSKNVDEASAGLSFMMTFLAGIVSIFGTILMSVLAEWLFGRHTAAAANMIRTRTGAHIGTGVVGAMVSPIACILLLCLIVTIPAAACIALALVAMAVAAGGFAGASLAKLAFPKLGRFASALLGGLILGIVGFIPILGGLVHVLLFMYLLGYVLQSIYLNMRGNAGGGGEAPTIA